MKTRNTVNYASIYTPPPPAVSILALYAGDA